MATKIEWADETWNPVTGCSKVGEGCRNCYAERMAKRLRGRYGYPVDDPFKVTIHPDRLDDPFRWRKPRRVFVCSMSDFFHSAIPLDFQAAMLSVMRKCPQHTFQILTKRDTQLDMFNTVCGWPELPNVWLGVTAENQRAADIRIPALLKVPAALRFISAEPLLEEIDLTGFAPWCGTFAELQKDRGIHWVIVGGETGPGARLMEPEWARTIRDDCAMARVPFFMKQMMKKAPIPDDLMIRECPQGI